MKRTVTVLLCAAMLAVVGCSDTKDNNKSGDTMKQYQSNDGSMVLTYTPPEGWNFSKNSQSKASLAVRPRVEGDRYIENIMLTRGPAALKENKTLAGYVETHMAGIKKFSKDFNMLSSETVKFGDVEAQEIVFTCSRFGGLNMPFKIKKWLVVGYGNVYDMTATSLQSDFDQYEKIFDKAAQSMRWVPATKDE